MVKERIIVVDDEENVCRGCVETLRDDWEITAFTTASEALRHIREEGADLVLLDLKMPNISGQEVLRRIKEDHPECMVIIITGYATVETAVASMKLGAFDYVSKPFTSDELFLAVERAFQHKKLLADNSFLRQELTRKFEYSNIVGESDAMKRVCDLITRVAPTDTTVLIQGESGTGKELVSRAIHNFSKRRNNKFVVVDCASLAQSVIESELFGYVKGAFTGATEAKAGLLEIADEGTLFLDEIANISLETQAKLLRMLQEQEFKRVGDSRCRKTNIRFIAATNRDLEKLIEKKLFREDLFYRLDVFRISLPPLRERKEDIPFLARTFLDFFGKNMHKDLRGFSPEAMMLLKGYDWPGNVRELKNAIERLVIMNDEAVAGPIEVSYALGGKSHAMTTSVPKTAEELKKTRRALIERVVADVEKVFILEALERNNWNVTRAAEDVGLLRTNFHALMRKYHIDHYGKTG